MQDFSYIQKHYGVPAERGRRIRYKGEKEGVIVASTGGYIMVVLDGEKATHRRPYHPTDQIEYLGMGTVPRLTASQRRYQQYLDADSGLSFMEWLKWNQKSKMYN